MGLIAHYRMDGSVEDAVGSTPTSVYGEFTWVSGKIGSAAHTDSTSQYYTADIGPMRGEFSLAFWYRCDSVPSTWTNILSKMTSDSNNELSFRFAKNGVDMQCYVGNGSSSMGVLTFPRTRLFPTIGDWYHITITRKPGDKLRLFRDGVEVASGSTPNALSADTGQPLKVLNHYTNSVSPNGAMQDLRIYDHALSPREVRDLSLGLDYRLPMLGDLYDVARSGEAKDNGVEVLHDRWSFDGSSYVETDYYLRTYPGDSFSISLWFRTSGSGRLSEVRDGSKPGSPIVSMQIGSGFTFLVRGSNGVRRDTNTPNMGLNDNEWHHVVVVVNGWSKVYIDGELAGENTNPVDMGIDLSGIPLHIGCRNLEGAVDQYYTGDIRDYRVYATAFTADQVKELYQQKASIDSGGNIHASSITSKVAFQHEWDSFPFSRSRLTVDLISDTTIITSTHRDPTISMYNLGSFDPLKYRFIQVLYRVVSGEALGMELYFTNSTYSGATSNQRVYRALISDGNWHVANVDMSAHPLWDSSPVTGWRYDPCTATDVTMELGYIRLIEDASPISVDTGFRAQDISEVGVTRGLVAWYPLIGDILDYAGTNHAVNNGAVATAEGYEFDGSTSYLDVGNTPETSVAGSITLSAVCWLNPDGHAGSHNILAKWGNNAYRWRVWKDSSGWLLINDGSGYEVVSVSAPFATGEWVHHTVTADLSSGDVRFYNNGVLTGQATTAKTSIEEAGALIVGARDSSPSEAFGGTLRDVRIHNVALTPEEVAIQAKLALNQATKSAMTQGCLYTKGQIKEVIS